MFQSAEMAKLESVYGEMAIVKMKYDHLFSVCTNLLNPWPDRDNDGKLVPKEQRLPQENVQTKETTASAELEFVEKSFKEMKLLDTVLQKAKKLHTSQHKPKCPNFPVSDKSKSCSLSSKSSQQAAKVYKPPTSKLQKSARVNSFSKGYPKSSAITGQRKKLASSAKEKRRGTAEVPDRLNAKIRSSSGKEIEDVMQRRCCSSSTSVCRKVEREAESPCRDSFTFDIKQHGTKLSMPSKYYKLQQALCKLSKQPLSSADGQRFCQYLSSHSELDAVYNTVLSEELSWLKERLLSLTPHELTVNERSPWEDVWKIKTTLEAVTEHAQKLRVATPPLLKNDTRRTSALTTPTTFAYSSVEEWVSMATDELQMVMSQYELNLLEFVSQELLPLLPVDNCPTHMLQTIYELAGISKPIYVKLSNNEN